MITVRAHIATTVFHCNTDKTMVHAIVDLVCLDEKSPFCYRLTIKEHPSVFNKESKPNKIVYTNFYSLLNLDLALEDVRFFRDSILDGPKRSLKNILIDAMVKNLDGRSTTLPDNAFTMFEKSFKEIVGVKLFPKL